MVRFTAFSDLAMSRYRLPEIKTKSGVLQDGKKAIAVFVVGKDVPTVVAAKDDMINRSGYIDPLLSCHCESIAGVIKLSMPGPKVSKGEELMPHLEESRALLWGADAAGY